MSEAHAQGRCKACNLLPPIAHQGRGHDQQAWPALFGLLLPLALQEQIEALEKRLQERVQLRRDYRLLKSVPGIGQTLATTIMLETGTVARFAQVGNFSSYCRCVDSVRKSNGKKKGEGNAKNGNKYLAWAFVEAANFAVRFCPDLSGSEPCRSGQKPQVRAATLVGAVPISFELVSEVEAAVIGWADRRGGCRRCRARRRL